MLELVFKYLVDLFFTLGLFFNAILFVPQAIKIYKSKNVSGLSAITFAGFNIMQFFTALHGYLTGDYLLMIGFLLSLVTCACVTVFIFRFRKNKMPAHLLQSHQRSLQRYSQNIL
jgi:MtN3 and saliva related transmembrane protein